MARALMILGTVRSGEVTVRSRGVIETRTSPNAPGRNGQHNDAPAERTSPARRAIERER